MRSELERYGRELERRRLVRDRHLPFFIRWVDRYLVFCEQARPAANLAVPAFVASLGKDAGIQDWQVRQAEHAVRLFHQVVPPGHEDVSTTGEATNELRGDPSAGMPAVAASGGAAVPPTDWSEAEEKMRYALRVKHYSPRTEGTYLEWVRDFAGYARGRSPAEVDTETVRDYLRFGRRAPPAQAIQGRCRDDGSKGTGPTAASGNRLGRSGRQRPDGHAGATEVDAIASARSHPQERDTKGPNGPLAGVWGQSHHRMFDRLEAGTSPPDRPIWKKPCGRPVGRPYRAQMTL
jgi:hypothetical protein